MDYKNVLVFGAHPDDEIIGVGGTIARFKAEGAIITIVIFTGGETGHPSIEDREKVRQLRVEESKKCDQILGIGERIVLGKPTQGVVNDRETYQECVRIIRRVKLDVIFTHYFEDKHRDHRAVSEVTDEARWKASENVLADYGEPWYTGELYYYETTDLITHPDLVVDITSYFEKKKEAMSAQTSQLGVLPGVISYIEGLGKVRGFLCGTDYGEAFLRSKFLPRRI